MQVPSCYEMEMKLFYIEIYDQSLKRFIWEIRTYPKHVATLTEITAYVQICDLTANLLTIMSCTAICPHKHAGQEELCQVTIQK